MEYHVSENVTDMKVKFYSLGNFLARFRSKSFTKDLALNLSTFITLETVHECIYSLEESKVDIKFTTWHWQQTDTHTNGSNPTCVHNGVNVSTIWNKSGGCNAILVYRTCISQLFYNAKKYMKYCITNLLKLANLRPWIAILVNKLELIKIPFCLWKNKFDFTEYYFRRCCKCEQKNVRSQIIHQKQYTSV